MTARPNPLARKRGAGNTSGSPRPQRGLSSFLARRRVTNRVGAMSPLRMYGITAPPAEALTPDRVSCAHGSPCPLHRVDGPDMARGGRGTVWFPCSSPVGAPPAHEKRRSPQHPTPDTHHLSSGGLSCVLVSCYRIFARSPPWSRSVMWRNRSRASASTRCGLLTAPRSRPGRCRSGLARSSMTRMSR